MKKILVFALVAIVSLGLAFAAEGETETQTAAVKKEHFRVEAEATVGLSTNGVVTTAPEAEALLRITGDDNHFGLIGGYGAYLDIFLTDPISIDVQHHVFSGVTFYGNDIYFGFNFDEPNGDLPFTFTSIHYRYNWKLRSYNLGSFGVADLGLKFGLDTMVSTPHLDSGDKTADTVDEIILTIFSAVPRVSVGATVGLGGAF